MELVELAVRVNRAESVVSAAAVPVPAVRLVRVLLNGAITHRIAEELLMEIVRPPISLAEMHAATPWQAVSETLKDR